MRLLITIFFSCSVFFSWSQVHSNQIESWISYTGSSFSIHLYPPSVYSDSLQWKIQGIDGIIRDRNPSFIIADTGTFKVELYDTTGKVPFYYNTFLVLKNDSLSSVKPKVYQCGYGCGSGYDLCFSSNELAGFRVMIFNRWGEIIFESAESEITWQKQQGKTGVKVPEDVYVYLLKWTDRNGNHQRFASHWTYYH